MDSFPDELLLRIFKHIPSKDRRNSIRLVCHRWNRIARDRILTQDEWIEIGGMYEKVAGYFSEEKILDEKLTFLQLHGQKIFNLIFENLRFRQVHQFWKVCGSQVRSLIFQDCDFSLDFESIISRCPNVKHISLRWYNSHFLNKWLQRIQRSMDFEVQSVSSFYIILLRDFLFEFRLISYQEMYNVLSIFPNLEELKIVIDSTFTYEGSFWENNTRAAPIDRSPLTAIAHYVQMQKKMLKKLWLLQPNRPIEHDNHVDFSGVLSELENLEELVVTGSQFLNFTEMIRPYAFLECLSNLTVLYLSKIPADFYDEDEDRYNYILLLILNSLSNLQDFRFEAEPYHTLLVSACVIYFILSSKLESLHLIGSPILPAQDPQLQIVNRTLKELVIFSTYEPWTTYSYSYVHDIYRIPSTPNLISPYCENLRHIAISYPDDTVLQNIFKYHKSLTSLMLVKCEKCSDFGFTGWNPPSDYKSKETYSIKELNDLEYLTIRNLHSHRTKRISTQFILPKLRSFEIDFVDNCCGDEHKLVYMNNLIQAVKKNTLLEAAEFHVRKETDLPEKLLKQLLIPLKRLRFLSLTFKLEKESWEKPDYRKVDPLFDVCPSLRFIVYRTSSETMEYLCHRTPPNGFESLPISTPFCKKPREMLPNWSNLCKDKPGIYSNLDVIEF